MNTISALFDLLPLIYPRFYCVNDTENNELVVLKLSNEDKDPSKLSVADKTQYEAVVNHVHLFDKVGRKNYDVVVEIGKSIAKNLLSALMQSYPSKNFVVYLEVDVSDSVIIRFHQIWEGEPPYIDVNQTHTDVTIFEFKTE